jgi:hypothetical protein
LRHFNEVRAGVTTDRIKLRHAAALAIAALLLFGCGSYQQPEPAAKWIILAPPTEGDTAPLSKWHGRGSGPAGVEFQSKELCEDGIANVREFDRREGAPPKSIYGPAGEYVCVSVDDPRLKRN